MEFVHFFVGTTSNEDGTPLSTCEKLEPLCWMWTCIQLIVEWMQYVCGEHKTVVNYLLWLIAILMIHRSFVWYRTGIAIARYRQDLIALRAAQKLRSHQKRELQTPNKKEYRHNQPWGQNRVEEKLETPNQTVEQPTTYNNNNTINKNQKEDESAKPKQLKSILKNKTQAPLPQTAEDQRQMTISQSFNAAMNRLTMEIVRQGEAVRPQRNYTPYTGRVLPLAESPRPGLRRLGFKTEAGDSLRDNKPRSISRNRSNQRTRNESLSRPQARTPFTNQSTRSPSLQSRRTQDNSKTSGATSPFIKTRTKVINSTRFRF